MFEYAQSVFQHPNYDSELLRLYQLRLQQYTISEKEMAAVKKLLLTGTNRDPLPYALNPDNYVTPPKGKTPGSNIYKPCPQSAYYTLTRIIQYQIDYINEYNQQIDAHPLKRFLPDILVKKSTKNLEVAMRFVRYHHGNLMSLNNPDIAFNHSLGNESRRKRFELLPKGFNPTHRKISTRNYTAKNIAEYLADLSSSFIFFRNRTVEALHNAFVSKINDSKRQMRRLEIVKNKQKLRAAYSQKCKEHYTDIGGSVTASNNHPFIKRLASFLGFTRPVKPAQPPMRNLLMQEIKTKLEDTTIDTDTKSKIKAVVGFSKFLPRSTNTKDYSVLDGNPDDFIKLATLSGSQRISISANRYDAFIAGPTVRTDISGDPKKMMTMTPPLTREQFQPKSSIT